MLIPMVIAWWFLTLNATDKGPWLQQLGPFETEQACALQQAWVRNGGKTDGQVRAERKAEDLRVAARRSEMMANCADMNGGRRCTSKNGCYSVFIDEHGQEMSYSSCTGISIGARPVEVPDRMTKCFEGPAIPLDHRGTHQSDVVK